MTTVSIDQRMALDLVESRLKQVNDQVAAILERWHQDSAVEMIERTRKGKLPEAEIDAIALTNLLEKREQLEGLLKEVVAN